MATQTPNFNLNKPAVGADDDVWGGLTNDNWDILDALLLTIQGGVSPIGVILMWSGTIADVPDGYGVCDGSAYTRTDGAGSITSPDLRSRFIVGSSGDGTGDYQTGSQGGGAGAGSVPVTVANHELSSAESGGHAHEGFSATAVSSVQEGAIKGFSSAVAGSSEVYVEGNTGPGVQSVGGNDPHGHPGSTVNLAGVDIDPAWHALAYIIKI